jgi:hypothetical protein
MLRPDLGALTPDPVFPEGWASALRDAIYDPDTVTRLAGRMGLSNEHLSLSHELEDRLFSLSPPVSVATEPDRPVVSVTGMVTYAQCAKRYFWSDIDPLPRRRNRAAVWGTEVHRRIELHQRGQVPLDLTDVDLYDVSEEASPGSYDSYLGSRFSRSKATLVEAPFTLVVGPGVTLRGRIDAIYEEGGAWEVVDFKSGTRSDDPSRIVQLQAYALAAHDHDFGLGPPQQLTMTFAYLGNGGEEVSYEVDEDWMSGARMRIDELSTGMTGETFVESPGPWCSDCDFLRFCAPGRRFVG